MPKRVFSLEVAERDEPVEFQLGDVLYRCVDEPPAGALFALMTSGAVTGTIRFIEGVIVDEQTATFREQLSRKGRGQIVTEHVLADVLTYLTGEYTDRPTPPPESSPGGRQATNGSSALVSASQA